MTLKFLSRGSSHLHIAKAETLRLRDQLARFTGPPSVLNSAREALLMKVSTDSGLVGWGETYALAGVCDAIGRVLVPLLVGRNPFHVRVLWRSMWDATFGNGFAVGG